MEVWNHVMYDYASVMVAEGTDEAGRLELHVSTYPSVHGGPTYIYEYDLTYDASSGEIIGGTWKSPETGPERQRRPDFTWYPGSPGASPAAGVDESKARSIIY